MKKLSTTAAGKLLSQNLNFEQRAQLVRFIEEATIGHWAEVVAIMREKLVEDGHSPDDGSVLRGRA